MTKVIFEWADTQIIQSGEHFFIRYDAGSHQVVMREDKITAAEAAEAAKSTDAAANLLFKLQRSLLKRGINPYKSNILSPSQENLLSRIETVMTRLTELCTQNNETGWARWFEDTKLQLRSDPVWVKSKILSQYGGMGSLNDVVLHCKGVPCLEENDIFDNLRRELSDLCRNIID